MNNEPVAWMYQDDEGRSVAVYRDTLPCGAIPLYTHPVKELTAQEVMEQTHKKISEAHWKVKELTDEEITEIAKDCGYANAYHYNIRFARAILRKAQEK